MTADNICVDHIFCRILSHQTRPHAQLVCTIRVLWTIKWKLVNSVTTYLKLSTQNSGVLSVENWKKIQCNMYWEP